MYENGEQNGQLDTAAISLHELYSSYVRAGFTEEQAFQLTTIMLSGAHNI